MAGMTAPIETCALCRFDGAHYDVRDALGTVRAVAAMWNQTVEGVADEVVRRRPSPEVWSAAEYAAHSADVTEAMSRLLHGLLTIDDLRIDVVPSSPEPDISGGAVAAIERLRTNMSRLHDLAAAVGNGDDPRWARVGTIGGVRVDAAWVLRHAVHDATHHLSDAGRGLHLLGAGAPTQHGTIVALNVSGGGVPKRPVESAEVRARGMVGDRQRSRQHHGKPLQALCLWSSDVIDALRAEGHPIRAGAAGENVTISGVDWGSIRPGVRILIGDVVAEVSAYATPCRKNARWFVDRDFNRMLHDRHPGWSRVYAWVREAGNLHSGDPVVVEPPARPLPND